MGHLVDVLLRGLVLLAITAAVSAALRRQSAASRHLLWTLAAAGLLAVPVLTSLIPAVPVAIPGELLSAAGPPRTNWAPSTASPSPTDAGAGPGQAKRAEPAPAPAVTAPERPAAAGSMRGEAATTGFAWLPRVWLLGFAVLAGALLLERLLLRRLWRAGRPADDSRVRQALARGCAELGLRRAPACRLSARTSMPLTWGVFRHAVVLPETSREWSDDRLRSVLCHELAHVKRRDYLTQLIAGLAVAVHWPNPLAWWMSHRLQLERELASDDVVLHAGGRADSYARDLLAIAQPSFAPAPLSAGIAMARPSQLGARIRAVLDRHRRRGALSRRTLAGAVLLAAGLAMLAATVTPRATAAAASTAASATVPAVGLSEPRSFADETERRAFLCWRTGGRGRWQSSVGDGPAHGRMTWTNDHCQADVSYRGEPELDSEFERIVGMPNGAHLRIEETQDGVIRRLEMRSSDGGELTIDWTVDGRRQPFDERAQAWFRPRLRHLLRRTGFAAQRRVRWLFELGGLDAVLDEIDELRSNDVRRAYLDGVDGLPELRGEDRVRLLARASQTLTSNSTRAGFLHGFAVRHPQALTSGSLREPYWDAVAAVTSNSEKRELLEDLLDVAPDDPEVTNMTLATARRSLSSNSDKARFLLGFAHRHGDTVVGGSQLDGYWRAVASLSSNSEKGRLLLLLAEQTGGDPTMLAHVLEAARSGLSSNSEKGRLLIALGDRYPRALRSGQLRDAFWTAARSLSSRSEYRRVVDRFGPPDAVPDDSEYVVTKQNIVYLSGMVKDQGYVDWEDGMTAQQAVRLAGGLAEGAAAGWAKLYREADGRMTETSINLADENRQTPIEPGDIIHVPRLAM